MDKWKNLLYKQVKLRQHLKKRGIIDTFDLGLFQEICDTMTELGYDVDKLITQYKRRIQ